MDNRKITVEKLIYAAVVILSLAVLALILSLSEGALSTNPVYQQF